MLSIRQRILLFNAPSARKTTLPELLRRAGIEVATCDSLDRALALLDGGPDFLPPDLLILRMEGTARDGLGSLQRIRAVTPILIVLIGHAMDGYGERVAALELGADDYLTPGMQVPEMLARIRAVLRRGARTPAVTPIAPSARLQPGCAIQGGWRLVPRRRAVVSEADGQVLALTSAEFELLHLLESAGGGAVDRETISRAVFRRPWRIEDRAVDGLVKRLRRKLQADAIASVRGIGYALRLADTSASPGGMVEICVPESASASPVMQFQVVD